MPWHDHITSDPAVCHGKPCIKGTRVMVSVVLDNLAAGESAEAIAAAYRITPEDVRAALQYAAALSHDLVIPIRSGAA
jgi:uncharacterized protein (DUF433 family)